MKPAERDELLIRMDERLKAIKDGDEGDIPEIKTHLCLMNDKVNNNSKRITQNETKLWFLFGGGGALAGIAKWLGWMG